MFVSLTRMAALIMMVLAVLFALLGRESSSAAPGEDTFNSEAVAAGVRSILTADSPEGYGITDVDDVSCPSGQPVSKGTIFDCTLTVEGESRAVTVTVTGDEDNPVEKGNYTVGLPR